MTTRIKRSPAEIAQKIDQIRQARRNLSILSLSPSVQIQRRASKHDEEMLVAYYSTGELPENANAEIRSWLEGSPCTDLENYGSVEALD